MLIRTGALLISSVVLSVSLIFVPVGSTARSAERHSGITIVHHNLTVQIDPAGHGLIAEDRLQLDVGDRQVVQLSLASGLIVDRVTLGDDTTHELPFEVLHAQDGRSAQVITIPAAAVSIGTMRLALAYHGIINDPPREPRHLRFVTPSETAGHIGSEGIYLSSETQWYPDIAKSLSTFDLQVALPDSWTPVTQAKPHTTRPCPVERCRQAGFVVTEWTSTLPSEALTLVANRFTVKTRDWTAGTGQRIQLATYLFPDDAALADEYLDATARYLDAYIPLLGHYPFETFAVVENFFSSGLGMPSFTLLGSGIIKRHYVQPYALGHEIVHSWIGNSVYNRVDRGNWVEGLTTYLANYYWYEILKDSTQARDQRQLLVRGYNLHVSPGRDYPLGQFTQKQDERDNAIGYQKAAMVFHLLRQEVGEAAFWSGLKRLVTQYSGRHAEWQDLERIVAEASRRDLRWFFAQWVEQAGAPSVSMRSANARRHAASSSFLLEIALAQTGTVFTVPVMLRVEMEDGGGQTQTVRLNSAAETIKIDLPAKPLRVSLDPDSMLLRRIPRRDLPPVLNHYVTDPGRSVIAAVPADPSERHPFRDVTSRIEAQDAGKPVSERTTIMSLAEGGLLPKQGSVLLLGHPGTRRRIAELLQPHCGDRLSLSDHGVTVGGTVYEGTGTAVLVSCRRGDQPDSVLTLLYAVTPRAASSVARLLFFYGWNSYVVFQDGAVAARGEWASSADRMEVSIDAEPVVR